MGTRLIVEVLDQRGGVRSRTRIADLPATIGRGFDSDVVLDDPYVCPRHAELSVNEAGDWLVRDAGSVNGIRPTARAARVPELRIKSGSKFRLGQTDLRVIDADAPLPPSLVESKPTLAMRLTAGKLSAGVIAVCTAVFLFQGWLIDTSNQPVFSSLGALVFIMFMLLLWGGMWALATRIIQHRFRLFAHLAWASSMAAILTLSQVAGGWLSFAFPSFSSEVVEGCLLLVIVPLGLAGHLSLSSSMSRGARWRASLLFSGVVMLIPLVLAYSESDTFDAMTLSYPSAIRPLPRSLVHTVSLDAFMKSAGGLEAEVDSLLEDGQEDIAPAIIVVDPSGGKGKSASGGESPTMAGQPRAN